MLDVIIKGGPLMIPLLVLSVLAVAVSLERLWYLSKTRSDPDELMDEVKLSLEEDKPLEAMQTAKQSPGPVASLVAAGIAYSDRDPEAIRQHLEEVGQDEVFKMERGLGLLGSIITVSPLIGLLGTVTGIIRSFRVLGAFEGVASNPAALSVGIAEALISTAAGLFVAIPAMLIHNWITGVIERRVRDMNRNSMELIELLDKRKERV